VLGPDINESNYLFTVNKKGDIRFGLGSIKGVGENAVTAVIDERSKNGPFADIFNFVERVNLSAVSRKSIENFVIAGGFDNFGLNRSQYFLNDEKGIPFIENIIKYGNRMQVDKSSTANTLFGGMSSTIKVEVTKPEILKGPEWGQLEQLNKEKELVGIYLSAHPLDPYRFEFEYLCTHRLADLTDLKPLKGKDIVVAGLVTEFRQGITKTNKPYATIIIEDFTNTYRFNLFGKDFVEYSRFFGKDWPVLIKAKILPRQYGDTNELEFKPSVVFLLNEAREELIKSILLKVPVNIINDELINDLEQSIETKDGKALLKFMIFDPDENLKIDMISRNLKLKVSNGFINFIKSKPEIELALN
jgi:DNA polymerase-3 subunit alpha